MGADLFIRKLTDYSRKRHEADFYQAIKARDEEKDPKIKEEKQKEVLRCCDLMYGPGYFRDCYNGAGLFAWLGISWWQDVSKLLNRRDALTPKNAKILLEMVKSKELPYKSAKQLELNHCEVDDNEHTPEAWYQSKLEHRQEFIQFLELAISLRQNIYCSL